MIINICCRNVLNQGSHASTLNRKIYFIVCLMVENTFTDFIAANSDNLKSEIYIPAVVNDLISRKEASVKILPAVDRWFGVTYKEDKPLAIENINGLISQGVYPDNLWD